MDTCLGLYRTCLVPYGKMSIVYNSMELCGFSLESLDTWFRTLYLVCGLGVGTPKLISCRVELRRVLRILDACFRKGLVAS